MMDETKAAVQQSSAPAVRATQSIISDADTTVIQRASALATELARFVEERKLYAVIKHRGQESKHIKYEAWATLGAMLGLAAREVSVVENGSIFVATVEVVRLRDGMVLARASAECGAPDERDRDGLPIWSTRPRYARRSMAITRAASKAYRLALAWIVTLAGYAPTPAEELEEAIDVTPRSTRSTATQPSTPTKRPSRQSQPPRRERLIARILELQEQAASRGLMLTGERIERATLEQWPDEQLEDFGRSLRAFIDEAGKAGTTQSDAHDARDAKEVL